MLKHPAKNTLVWTADQSALRLAELYTSILQSINSTYWKEDESSKASHSMHGFTKSSQNPTRLSVLHGKVGGVDFQTTE